MPLHRTAPCKLPTVLGAVLGAVLRPAFWRLLVAGLIPMPVVIPGALAATRGLLVGIDDYNSSGRLSGAAADARDIEAALRGAAVEDIALLVDAQAKRSSVIRALADLRSRVKPGDLVILGFAGLGSLEKSAGSADPSVANKTLLLFGFDANAPAASQRILLDEIRDAVAAMDAAGARVLAVVDAGFGRDDVRVADPRASQPFKVRSLPQVVLGAIGGQSPRAASSAAARRPDLVRSLIIEAGSGAFTVPEVNIVGADIEADRWRGALSYAIARGIEIATARGVDPVLDELAAYAGTLAYQLSDQRQSVFVSGATRGIKQIAGPGMPIKPQPAEPASGPGKRQGPVVPIAAIDGRLDHFKGLSPQDNAFVVVTPSQNPVLLWDTSKQDVIVGGDVIAQNVTRDEIPGIVDRVVAVRGIKQMTAQSPQSIVVTPGGGRHRQGQRIGVEIEDVANRALVLFNIAGNGKVQLLYPIGSDPPIIEKPGFRLELSAQEPFGADQIVAITAPVRMNDIEHALNRLKDRATSGQLQNILSHYAPASSRIGTVGIFTGR